MAPLFKKKALLVLLCSVILMFNTPAVAKGRKRILILNSYHHGYHWTDEIMRGIKSAIDETMEFELLVEYMDTKRHFEGPYLDFLKRFYRYKYTHVPIDIIISTDDHALDFLLEYRKELFNGIPIVFCGIDKADPERLKRYPLVFGIEEELDLKKNLEMALGFHPDTRAVTFVSDLTKSGRSMLVEAHKVEALFKNRLEFNYLVGQSIADLKNSLGQLPPGSLVFYLIFTRDKNDYVLTLDESMELVGGSTRAPVYITWGLPLKKGIMGGYVASGFNQGKYAAMTAKKFLKTGEPSQIPAIQTAPHIYLFNYPELERFRLSPSDLPKNSVLRNQPHSFYREYKRMVWGVVSLFLGLVAVVMVLSINSLRRKKAEQRLKTVLETANEGFWEINRNDKIVDVNAEICSILGREKHEILDHSLFDFVPGQYIDILKNQLKTRKKGVKGSYELAFIRPDSKITYGLVKASPLLDRDSRLVGSFAMITNITDRKRAEKELKKNQRNLHRSESMFRAISEFADLGILLFNHQGMIYSNKKFIHIMGVVHQKLTMEYLYTRIYAEDLFFVKNYLNNLLKGNYHGPMRFELRINRRDKIHFYRAHAQEIEYEEGPAVQVFLDDITEQKELANRARINELKMYHEDRLAALGVMATGIAHEINQPLNTIRVIADGFLYGRDDGWGLDPDEVYEGMEMVSRQVVRMVEVIQTIRNFARDDRSSTSESIDPNRAIDNVLSMIGRQLKVHGIELELQTRNHLPKVLARLNRLEQVIMNLVINARQALSASSVAHKKLWIKTGFCYGRIFIEVGDNGDGIPKEIINKIFDPFFTTKEIGKGTGLGLAISKAIISDFGGDLKAYNNSVKGATFFVTLPCRKEK